MRFYDPYVMRPRLMLKDHCYKTNEKRLSQAQRKLMPLLIQALSNIDYMIQIAVETEFHQIKETL